jgi:hypothetical protein
MKHICRKTLPIEYELSQKKIPAANIMYSGDEVFLPGSSEANAGIDDSVALLAMKQGNGKMFVVNTNVNEHDTVKRPGLVWIAGVMQRNGINADSSTEAGIFLHEKLLERLEYNIGRIAADSGFEPENVVQSVKGMIAGGSVEFYAPYDFSNAAERVEEGVNSYFGTVKVLQAA